MKSVEKVNGGSVFKGSARSGQVRARVRAGLTPATGQKKMPAPPFPYLLLRRSSICSTCGAAVSSVSSSMILSAVSKSVI